MDDNITNILLLSLAAVILLGIVVYSIYRSIQTNRLRKRLEDEAWQRHIGKHIPWEIKTRPRPVPSAVEIGNKMHQQIEDYYRQKDVYLQQVGRTKVEGRPTTSLFPPSSFELPSSGWAKEPDPPFPVGGGGFSGGGGGFGGGGASDSWGSSDSCSSDGGGGFGGGGASWGSSDSCSSDGGEGFGGGGGDCGGSSD